MALTKKLHTQETRSEVQDFECGGDKWATEVADWIKGKDPFYFARKRQTRTWLYYNENNELVGYGSLGPYTCPPLTPDDPSCLMQLFPWLGIQSKFHRQGYATEICLDLLSEAQDYFNEKKAQNEPIVPLVLLFVHQDNYAAINMYRKIGFRNHHKSNHEDGQVYNAMIILLDWNN